MDYLKFVEHHRNTNADITIGCLPIDYERASDFGLMKIDDEGRIYVSDTASQDVTTQGFAKLQIAPFLLSCALATAFCWASGLMGNVDSVQDFAEKPKGDALESMKVDTTILGGPGHLPIANLSPLHRKSDTMCVHAVNPFLFLMCC